MYFCYGIKNSSLEKPKEESVTRERRESQQMELTIPKNRLKQSLRPGIDANNKPNGFTSALSSSYVSQIEQKWQTFD
jgi:hypothetical protein